MKRQIVYRGIRITERLATSCDLSAAKAQIRFSEWAREAFELKLKLEAKGLKKK